MRSFLCLFICLYVTNAFAQQAEDELAAQFFYNEEYDKAEILYKKLLKKNPESVYIYQNYLECLLKQKSLNEAEKVVSKQVKKYKSKPLYVVDLGYVYGLQGKEKEKKKVYESAVADAVDAMGNGQTGLVSFPEQLASAFLSKQEYGFAKSALIKARKAYGPATLFAQNLIDVYRLTKDYESLINECLLVLNFDANQLASTKANLVFLVDTDTKIDYLQEKASIYVQKYPEKTVYTTSSFCGYLCNKKNLTPRSGRLSAMDRRNKTEGKNLIDLAIIGLSNKNYAVAIKCYDKIIEFGEDGYFYLNAKMGSLETNYKLVSETGQYHSRRLNPFSQSLPRCS